MSKRRIKKIAIIGSGIMGSGIACHFANIGVDVLLLDIVPRELNDKEKAKGLTLEDKVVRNRLVNDALTTSIKSKPAPLYNLKFAYDKDFAINLSNAVNGTFNVNEVVFVGYGNTDKEKDDYYSDEFQKENMDDLNINLENENNLLVPFACENCRAKPSFLLLA